MRLFPLLLAACLGAPVLDAAPVPAGKADMPVPFDVQAVVRQVHFAFRKEGDRFTGGHSTYGVEFAAGRLSVKPVGRGRHVGPPLLVQTASITRGGREIRPSESPAVDDRGRLVRRGSAAHETVENRDDGVELRWHFPARPPGRGGLLVRVAAAGLKHRGETSRGHHFQDPTSRLGVRFGHATWIGADGRRTEIAARWNGREILIDVPARVVDEAAYPAVLDPILGPEYDLTDPVTGPASGDQGAPSVASDPSGTHFVAWLDRRSSRTLRVFGTRVSAGGEVLDPGGVLLSATTEGFSGPSVVFDGTNFLIVFSAERDIWGRRVSPGGAVVDADPFPICSQADTQREPFAFSNGTTTLVVWDDYRNFGTTGIDVYGTRVSGATVLDGVGTGIEISDAPNNQSSPRLTWGNGNWLVVWNDRRSGTSIDVRGARVSGTTGAVLDPGGIPISTATGDQQEPWAASNGADYFVVWRDGRTAPSDLSDIYGARVSSSSGSVLDPAGLPVCAHGSYQSRPSIAFASGASNYQVVWEDTRDYGLFGNRVDAATGAVLDGAAGAPIVGSSAITARVWAPRIQATGSGYYVTWEFSGDSNRNVVGSRLTTAPLLLDAPGVHLAHSANGQTDVAVAADADNYLVVWLEDRGGSLTVYAARVSGTTGESLDAGGIPLSEGGYAEAAPGVAFNGTEFLVVWHDFRSSSGIFGTRVTTAGVVLDPGGVGLFTDDELWTAWPDVTSDGSGQWFVVGLRTGPGGGGVFGGRIDATGTILDPGGIPIRDMPSFVGLPRVAFGSDRYLVAWTEDRAVTGSDVYGARVSTGGVLLDAVEIPIATGPGYAEPTEVDVAFSSPHFVVVYAEDSVVSRARVAAATGIVVDTAELTPYGYGQPVITEDAGTLVVAYASVDATLIPPGVKGTRVSAAGIDLDPTDWDVVIGDGVPWNALAVAARPGSPGNALVAYTRYDPTPDVTADRVRARLITTPDVIFEDGFETGDVGAWSSAQSDGGDLAVGADAALAGTAAGMQVTVNDTAGVFVVDESPENEEHYRARFHFDPNGFDPGEAQLHQRTRIFIAFEENPARRLAAVVLRRLGGAYSLKGRARLDDGSLADTAFVPISDGPHVVEIHWRRATGPDAHDGSFEIWIDGTPAGTLPNLDNHASAVDYVHMGALSVKAGASGALYWDEFESRRQSYIGP